ncbi:hypothetical protein KIW84_071435 [Lathyrus oleraceus]|uniref:Reverse transcriptase n=1 Tax=Pisum sativum TaxID=3888 RepID=A0A9D4VI97_PEA|nr:hypothetical protein KIW84_071435 [Pisum sativum]
MASFHHIPDFNYHPKCDKLKITNVCFAVDLLLFSRGDKKSVHLIIDVFKQFCEATRIKENPTKCKIFFGGTNMQEQQDILVVIGFVEGRYQLVKSVLMAISGYWLQVFHIPKKIIKQIEAICRDILWSGKATGRKAYVSWDKIYEPKNVEGLNIKDLNIWNNAILLKLFWNLQVKFDKLWIKWIDVYYMKGKSVMQ